MSGPTDLDAAWALRWALLAQEAVSRHRIELMELDQAIGDGDHGENMDRGFTAVGARLEESAPPATPSEVLRFVATTLMSTVGGAAGPLYGTAFLRGAAACLPGEGQTRHALGGAEVATVLEAGLAGIVARGKAAPGEKTMVDAWAPAVRAARAAADAGATPADVLAAAAEAAETGAQDTEPMIATKGRASYLGPRSAGHRDPGAVSSALLLRAAADAAVRGDGAALDDGSVPDDAAAPDDGPDDAAPAGTA
ncbi:dihydroxyacetone kinase subunit DhaL [Georgenia faecalis]|uniref:Dihydroxyacetone kinase subunit DhaL n=1 Tax=Georgenia faecalis TaxID=2483799 RepID=A0ABV9DCL4_9MICO|nr:dihydroxyacetone kinase subunit DhaL [Georgenia faecalis]